jgi:hypothetical protein
MGQSQPRPTSKSRHIQRVTDLSRFEAADRGYRQAAIRGRLDDLADRLFKTGLGHSMLGA